MLVTHSKEKFGQELPDSSCKHLIITISLAEGVGFEPTDELPHLLISSQMPLTTQPPFRFVDLID